MEPNVDEALRAKVNAEKRFAEKDFLGAKNYALKAQMLCPDLEGVAQMVVTFGVHSAAEMKINGEIDFYAILGLDPSADKSHVKKQYKKMAVLLHPDKNKSVGADGAFKLVSEAWTVLSDNGKRSSYDHRRNMYSMHTTTSGNFDNYKSSASQNRLDTFWTVCSTCHVQYEYLRKYVNKRLSCKNCRGVFIAVETGLAPVDGSYPYCSWSYRPENGHRSHGSGVTYVPGASVYCANNGVSGRHSGHGSDYASNLSFQWIPGNSSSVADPSGLSSVTVSQKEKVKGTRQRGHWKQHMKKVTADYVPLDGNAIHNPHQGAKRGRPAKKMKVEFEGANNSEVPSQTAVEVGVANVRNVNPKHNSKLCTASETCFKVPPAPALDTRQLLINKARTVICKKLEEIKLVEEKKKALAENGESSKRPKREGRASAGHQSELRKTGSMTITVPDSDFHDFDKDRAEECFKPKQIWALYDEEDGMPRLYCLIRQVISLKPFKIHISYLSSKSDTEFGSVNWLCSGFTKSCGHFRAFNSEIVEQVNIFSHLLSREKAGRGGCVRIFPKSGDIWAVYRNWSPDWNRSTPDEVRHQYEMVEVLDDYSEELGVCVAPLVKVEGYKTVYKRDSNKEAIRWIQRREMLRFSHMVPSCLLKGDGTNIPEGCWDLDPAATPDELLQGVDNMEHERSAQPENSPRNNAAEEPSENKMEQCAATDLGQQKNSAISDESYEVATIGLQGVQDISNQEENQLKPPNEVPRFATDVHNREKPCQTEHFSSTPGPGEHLHTVTKV
ncbi:uncharacterized protein LOC116029387 [Ipomoea triloba]|uniref:uncharacterized protein LOC116029387 n=1 Tax=Ipomoea triloba TaxID=35885 RepID=UPI00125E2286|nr:uncharacterized protein LOC116029387 [Ipomoea triloba]XP_031127229.1 uncharacterized protein LOC116029387 [Ipomoea triloba]